MKPRPCPDGRCGAEDCPRCRPANFWPHGRYLVSPESDAADARWEAERVRERNETPDEEDDE